MKVVFVLLLLVVLLIPVIVLGNLVVWDECRRAGYSWLYCWTMIAR